MKQGRQPAGTRWPFDPLQPQSPDAPIPEEAKRVQKQTGAGGKGAAANDESPNDQGAKS